MQESEVAHVERSLRVTLPGAYRTALFAAGPSEADLPEFLTDAAQLIEANEHFTLDPSDLSSYERLWLVRLRLKFFPRSRQRLSERVASYKREWAGANRFFVGSDLGEERYFIVLTELPTRVYRFQLENGHVDLLAESIEGWLKEALRRQAEAASEV